MNKCQSIIRDAISKLNKIRINTFTWYISIAIVWALLIWTNIYHFNSSLSWKYPKLNISSNSKDIIPRDVASLKYANELVPIDSESLDKTLPKSYSSKIVYIKLKYKISFKKRFWKSIKRIPKEKKELFIRKIEEVLIRLNNKNTSDSKKLNDITWKLLALKELLEDSEDNQNVVIDEEIELNSAPEKEETEKKEVIVEKKVEKVVKKEEIKPIIEDKVEIVVEKPIIKVEPKVEEKVEIVPKKEVEPIIEVEKEEVKPVIKEEVEIVTKEPIVEVEKISPVVVVEPKVEEKVVVVVESTNSDTDIVSIALNKEINSILNTLWADIYRWFKIKISKNNNYVLEDWIWYTYVYSKYRNFWKWIVPTENDLSHWWLDKNSTVLLLDSKLWAFFVTDYKKVKLISNSIISWISNKKEFLSQAVDDKKYLHNDTDDAFVELKEYTQNLTSWLSRSNKISKIYGDILKNISYSTTFSISNKQIFSWISTFKNKVWICGWYTKLNLYMLSFAWVDQARVIKWFVIDAPDFPSIWHAWIQIWYQYYDPTFDDPIWASKTKSYSQYKYYWLPKDLFYTNRYDYYSLPTYLKTESLESRKKLIKENLSKFTTKYESRDYILLRPFSFRQNNSLKYDDVLTIEKLKKIIPYFEVKDYKYSDNWIEKIISTLDFYTITDKNIESLLTQVNYKMDWYILFKWEDWTYRLGYNVKIR